MSQQQTLLHIQSDRVHLRPWQRPDTLAQEAWPRYADPFSAFWNTPRSTFDSEYRFSYGTGVSICRVWAVEDRYQRLIGRISLREVEQIIGQARLGISLGAPYVGQGLGTEALSLFLNHYFGAMQFQIMRLDVAGFNRRAVHCYEHLGFDYIGNDWRHIGSDPALRLLDNLAYAELRPFFRRDRRGAWVQFFEMELSKERWVGQSLR